MPTTQEGRGIAYPSPFQDVASTYMPSTIRELYRLMEYYYVTCPEAFRILFDMSAFPVTDLAIEDASPHVANTYRKLFEGPLKAKDFCIDIGLDHHTFGLSYSTVLFPTDKFMQCRNPRCGDKRPIDAWDWKLQRKRFMATCAKCKTRGEVRLTEEKSRNPWRIKFVRWAPRDMRIEVNPVTGQMRHRYIPPAKIRVNVLSGEPWTVKTTPLPIVEAILNDRVIEVVEENLYFTRMPSPSLRLVEDGSGVPLLISALRHMHYINVMRRGSEAVAHDHIAPMRWLSPAANAGLNPADMISLSRFRDEVLASVEEHRKDPNLVMTLPFPVNIQNLGGDAIQLFVQPEIQQALQSMAAGLGMPLEFLHGTVSWSAGNVALRVLGNKVMNQGRMLSDFLRFSADRVGAFIGLRRVDQIGLTDFKLTDDPQRMQVMMNLYNLGLLTGESLVREATGEEFDDLVNDLREEQRVMDELMEERTIRQSEAQAKAQVAAMQIQQTMLPQQLMVDAAGNPMNPAVASGEGMPTPGQVPGQAQGQGVMQGQEQGWVDGEEFVGSAMKGDPERTAAWSVAQSLRKISPQRQEEVLARLRQNGKGGMAEMARGMASAGASVDMRPLPAQRAPRRNSMNTAPAA